MKFCWTCTCWLALGLLSAASIAAPALQGGSFEEAARTMDEGPAGRAPGALEVHG